MGAIDRAKSMRDILARRTGGHPVVFHHVPKCGGTSVGRALRMKYIMSQTTISPESSFQVTRHFTDISNKNDVMREVMDFREQMLLYWMFEGVKCISAHVRFSPRAYARFHETYKFITVLRSPVDRFISHYFWDRGRPGTYSEITEDFESFLQTGRAKALGNAFVRYYSGLPKETDFSSNEAIDAAIANLSLFDVVGRLDSLSEFTQDLRSELGINLKIGHENKMRQSSSVKDKTISSEIRQRVEHICQADLAVWNSVTS